MKRPVIVGFDPGATIGLAVINTDGELLFLTSKTGAKRGEIINIIAEYGDPLIIASDRRPLPKNVERLAKSMNAKTYYPFESLSTIEKSQLIKKYGIKTKNNHERDALAAALKAYKSYSSIFRKTKNTLGSLGLIEIYPHVISKLIFQEVENINEAIDEVLNNKLERVVTEEPKQTLKTDENLLKKIEELKEMLKNKEKDILIIQKFNERLKKEKAEMESKLLELEKKSFDKSEERIADISSKDEIIKKLKLFRRLEKSGFLPLIEMKRANINFICSLNNYLDLKDRVVLLESGDDLQLLNGYEIRAAIVKERINEEILKTVDFPIISERNVSIKIVEGYKVIEEKEFEDVVKNAKKIGLIKWLEEYKKRKH